MWFIFSKSCGILHSGTSVLMLLHVIWYQASYLHKTSDSRVVKLSESNGSLDLLRMFTQEEACQHHMTSHADTRQTIEKPYIRHKLNVASVRLKLLLESIDENERGVGRSPVHAVVPPGVRGRWRVVKDHLTELYNGEITNRVEAGEESFRWEMVVANVTGGWEVPVKVLGESIL